MLYEMVPTRQADAQMVFTAVGVILVGVALLIQDDKLFYGGVSAMAVGAVYLLYSVYTMMQYGKEVL